MSDRELLEKAVIALQVFHKMSPAPTLLALIDEFSERIDELKEIETAREKKAKAVQKQKERAVNNYSWSQDLTAKYEEAKVLRAAGFTINEICAKAGITIDQWYRRKNIDLYGRSKRKKQ